MNKPRLKAILKLDTAAHAYWLFIAAVAIGVFTAVDGLFGHSRQPIALGGALIAAYGTASLTHTFLSRALDGRFERLHAAIYAAADPKAQPETENAR